MPRNSWIAAVVANRPGRGEGNAAHSQWLWESRSLDAQRSSSLDTQARGDTSVGNCERVPRVCASFAPSGASTLSTTSSTGCASSAAADFAPPVATPQRPFGAEPIGRTRCIQRCRPPDRHTPGTGRA
jgi:hypothetical protein